MRTKTTKQLKDLYGVGQLLTGWGWREQPDGTTVYYVELTDRTKLYVTKKAIQDVEKVRAKGLRPAYYISIVGV